MGQDSYLAYAAECDKSCSGMVEVHPQGWIRSRFGEEEDVLVSGQLEMGQEKRALVFLYLSIVY